jgi:hypothetical protein
LAVDQQPAAAAPSPGDVSPDRQFVWDGSAWRPILRWSWEPTGWTRNLQLLAGGYFILQGVVGAVVLLTTRDQLRATVLQQMRHQLAAQPNPPDPAQVGQIADFSVGVALALGLFFALVGLALGVLTILRRWSWLFYVELVLLALGALGVFSNISNAANGYPAAL